MAYNLGKPLDFDTFGDQLRSTLRGANMAFNMIRMGSKNDPFYRVSIGAKGTFSPGPSGQENYFPPEDKPPLLLDVAPGPSVGDFQSVQIRSQQSDWHAYLGAEVYMGEEATPKFFDPMENLQRYVKGAVNIGQRSGKYGETPQQAFNRAITMGAPEEQLAGSVPRVGTPHSGTIKRDFASLVTVGLDPNIGDVSGAMSSLSRFITSKPEDDRFQSLLPYVPVSQKSSTSGMPIMRLQKAAIGMIGDDMMLGIGEDPANFLKRRKIGWGGLGTRENVDLFKPDESGTKLEQIQPRLIGEEGPAGLVSGLRYSNLIFPEEQRRSVGVVRENVLRQQNPFPGGEISYVDPLGGEAFMAGYSSQKHFKMPSADISAYARGAEFEFGIFEGGKRTGDTEGTYVQGGKTVNVGRYKLPGQDEWEYMPITAKGSGMVLGGEKDITLNMPQAMYQNPELFGMGQAGVIPDSENLPDNIKLLNKAQRATIERSAGVNVNYGAFEDVSVSFPYAKSVGTSVKGGGEKFGVIREMNVPDEALQYDVGGRTVQVEHAAPIKTALPSFMGQFASLSPTQQQSLVGELYPGGAGEEMSEYIGEQYQSGKLVDVTRGEGRRSGLSYAMREMGMGAQQARQAVRQAQAVTNPEPQAGALSAVGLSQTWHGATGVAGDHTEMSSYRMFEEMRQKFQEMPNERQVQYGGGNLGVVAGSAYTATSRAKQVFRHQAMQAYTAEGGLGLSPLEARKKYRETFETTRLDTKGNYMIRGIGPASLGRQFTPVVPEFAASDVKVGLAETAALQAVAPEFADFLGLGQTDSPGDTNRPPHVQAWKEISNVYRYNKEGSEFKNDLGEDISSPPKLQGAVELTEERATELEMAIAGGAGLSELGDITSEWGSGSLYNPRAPHGSQYLVQPGPVQAVSEYEYGETGGQPLNKMGRIYGDVLSGFIKGDTTGMSKMQQEMRFTLETKAGKAVKNIMSSYLGQASGGRYHGITGVDPGVAIVQQEEMVKQLRGMASDQGIPFTKELQGQWMGQVRDQMRSRSFVGVGQRWPNLGESTGAVTQELMLPDVAKEVFGLEQAPAATVGGGGQLIPGDPTQRMAFGTTMDFAAKTVGDLDIDPGFMLSGMRVNPEDESKLDFMSSEKIQEMGALTPKQFIAKQNEALTTMLGNAGGIPGGPFNEAVAQILKVGGPQGPESGLIETSRAQAWTQAVNSIKQEHGMGVVYNQRRLMRAAATSAGFDPSQVARGHSGGALSYQRYLDAAVAEPAGKEELEGFQNFETLVQGLYMDVKKQTPYFGSMSGKGQKWTNLSEFSNDPQIQQNNLNAMLGGAVGRAVSMDLEAGHMSQPYAALLMAQKGVAEPEEIERMLQDATVEGQITATDAMSVWKELETREGRDFTKTTAGIGVVSETFRRLEDRSSKDYKGDPFSTLEAIGKQGFTFQGESARIEDIANVGAVGTTMSLTRAAIGKTGPLLPKEVGGIMEHLSSMYSTGEQRPHAAQRILNTYTAEGDWEAFSGAGAGGTSDLPAQYWSAATKNLRTPDPLKTVDSVQARREFASSRGGTAAVNAASQPAPENLPGTGTGPGNMGGGIDAGGSGSGTTFTGAGGELIGPDGEINIGLLVQHMGQGKLHQLREQGYTAGVSAFESLSKYKTAEPMMGELERIFGKAKGYDAATFQKHFGQNTLESTAALEREIPELMKLAPREMQQFFQDYGADIKGTDRFGKQIAGAVREYKSNQINDFADRMTDESKIAPNVLDSTLSGYGREGRAIRAASVLREVGQANQAFEKGSAVVATPEEQGTIDVMSKKVADSFKEFNQALQKSREALGSETKERKALTVATKAYREYQLNLNRQGQAQLIPSISSVQARLDRAEDGGHPNVAGIRDELTGLQEKQAVMRNQELSLMQQGKGKSFGQTLKSLTGGWNIMYMGRMAKLGMGQLGQGYAEAEQYMQETGALGTRAFGAEASGGYESPEVAYKAAMIRGSGGFMGQARRAQTAVAGTAFSDVAGAGLTGLGAMSLASFVGTTVGATTAVGGALTALAGPIGVVAGAGAFAMSQAGYMADPERASEQVAAMSTETGFDRFMKGGTQFLKTTLPDLWRGKFADLSQEGDSATARTAELTGWMQQATGTTFGSLESSENLFGSIKDLDKADQLALARTAGMSEDFAESLPSGLRSELFLTGLRGDMTGPDFEKQVEQVGAARMAGLPTQEIAQLESQISGEGSVSSSQLLEREIEISGIDGGTLARMRSGLDLMARTPGILDDTAGMSETGLEVTRQAAEKITGGRWEQQYLQAKNLQAAQRASGMDPMRVNMNDFTRTTDKSPEEIAQFQSDLMLGGQQVGLQNQLLSAGITGYGDSIGSSSLQQMNQLGNALSFKTNTLTSMAMQGALPDSMAMGDISLAGEQTGLGWGTTGLQAGSTSGAEMAMRIGGEDAMESGAWQGAVNGVRDPTGKMVGGTRGLGWALKYAQRGMADDQMDLQKERLGLSSWYQHEMWGIQDQQRDLQGRQADYGFEYQERQFDMGGRQWEENRGLQRTEQLARRQWTKQDWATEESTSAMQWQWQQEDFDENIRFMSGRQRKMAERKMERATVMHGITDTQREQGQERQEELWAMADQQFAMEREHYDENREMIEENMDKQREFYEEGRLLQDEMIALQREYWEANHALSLKQIELQDEYKTTTEELQDTITLINQDQQDRSAALALEIELGMPEYILKVVEAWGKLKEVMSSTVPTVSSSVGGTYVADSIGHDIGGDMIPGVSYEVGESESEMVRPGTIGSVVTMGDLRTADRLYRDRWEDSSSFSSVSDSGASQQAINIYIGNKKIKEFIVDTISKELEVH